ncbi:hypothetical protein [Neptuniibacter sp. QD37_11]|uniref:hypothetical protein n=1 Tax=Neptuniibacter sp. QD37_11 TaxID=3398209 RepID=UPI0039F484C6
MLSIVKQAVICAAVLTGEGDVISEVDAVQINPILLMFPFPFVVAAAVAAN